MLLDAIITSGPMEMNSLLLGWLEGLGPNVFVAINDVRCIVGALLPALLLSLQSINADVY